jgi:hypothetical protein
VTSEVVSIQLHDLQFNPFMLVRSCFVGVYTKTHHTSIAPELSDT